MECSDCRTFVSTKVRCSKLICIIHITSISSWVNFFSWPSNEWTIIWLSCSASVRINPSIHLSCITWTITFYSLVCSISNYWCNTIFNTKCTYSFNVVSTSISSSKSYLNISCIVSWMTTINSVVSFITFCTSTL